MSEWRELLVFVIGTFAVIAVGIGFEFIAFLWEEYAHEKSDKK